jgi:DNA-binding transcriptional MerR regulator
MKEMLTIAQVSAKIGVAIHTLRHWESELTGVFEAYRTAGGQRRYTDQNVELLRIVKQLREEGYTLSGVRRVLSKSQK